MLILLLPFNKCEIRIVTGWLAQLLHFWHVLGSNYLAEGSYRLHLFVVFHSRLHANARIYLKTASSRSALYSVYAVQKQTELRLEWGQTKLCVLRRPWCPKVFHEF
jgi:hypothetical protein